MTRARPMSDAAGPPGPSRGRGRPAAQAQGSSTRDAILAAARESFATRGYAGTTIRAVAARAGVDPSLVHHYFGGKDDLLLETLQVPFDPRTLLPRVLEGDPETAAWRLLDAVLQQWDIPENRLAVAAVAQIGLTAPAHANPVRERLLPLILFTLSERLPEPAERRAQLVATQMIGLIVGRYMVGLEPLASMSRAELVGWLAPNVQRYLTGPVPATAEPPCVGDDRARYSTNGE